MLPRSPRSTLFPYTTLFRSLGDYTYPIGTTEFTQFFSSKYLQREDGSGKHVLALRSQLAVAGAKDRKSTRLNSSHTVISYAVFCLKKKKKTKSTSTDAETTI